MCVFVAEVEGGLLGTVGGGLEGEGGEGDEGESAGESGEFVQAEGEAQGSWSVVMRMVDGFVDVAVVVERCVRGGRGRSVPILWHRYLLVLSDLYV